MSGDWTRALNAHALEIESEKGPNSIMVMLDGPYGGSSIDLGEYETVLLVAGGSGVTFTLALLDDLVGRIVRCGRKDGERTQRIEFAWCVRSYGNIRWFASMLSDIAAFAHDGGVDLHISVFVTCLCDPEAVPDVPNMNVIVEKPSVQRMIGVLVRPQDEERGEKQTKVLTGGGLGIAVSGPASLTREATNAVACLSLADRLCIGKVGVHTELFAI